MRAAALGRNRLSLQGNVKQETQGSVGSAASQVSRSHEAFELLSPCSAADARALIERFLQFDIPAFKMAQILHPIPAFRIAQI
jgi:hypothetical protein